MLTRRKFLQASSMISLSPVVPWVMGSTARAVPPATGDRTLVIVQLDGGNDGLNTVVPFADDGYGRARHKLRLASDKLHRLNDHLGLHPSMRSAKELFDDGRLAIVQGVGYPNPDRSHFRSMKIWQTAKLDDQQHGGYGWLGRALDEPQLRANRADIHAPDAIFVGDQESPAAVCGRRSSAMALSRDDEMRLDWEPQAICNQSVASSGVLHQFVQKEVASAYIAAADFSNQTTRGKSNSQLYPKSRLGAQLSLVSQLISSGSQARVFYTVQNGYDTHAAQLYVHADLLREFSDAVSAFLNDLKRQNLDDRVVVLAFSEFGRRIRENDSQGTDHGTVGPVFLAGSPVRGGLYGAAADLSNLDQGDLRVQIDFRQVYATILDAWLGVASKGILGGDFEKLSLVA